jgi:hypothetical protein
VHATATLLMLDGLQREFRPAIEAARRIHLDDGGPAER